MKTFKYKLYNSKKNKRLDEALSISCDIFNFALSHKKELYAEYGFSISKYELQEYITYLKSTPKYKYWSNLNSTVIQDITDRIYEGYSSFFRAVKSKSKIKKNLPKCKKIHKYKSITFKQCGYKFLPGNCVKIDGRIYKYHKSREIEGKIKTLTVKRNTLGEYFIFVTTDEKATSMSTAKSGKIVGFDFCLTSFLVGSNGTIIISPKFFKQDRKNISKLSKKLSSKKFGSNNRQKARLDLARAHIDIENKRENFQWKLALCLVKEYNVIIIENLNLDEMKKRFGKSVSDLAFGEFIEKLEYLAIKYDKKIVKVGKWFPSSKNCSDCGNKNTGLGIYDQEWTCPNCGKLHDRNLNASINILEEGCRIVGASTIKTATQIPCCKGKSSYSLRISQF